MSKEDLIELQGVVTEVLAGGNYKVKCGENHEVLTRLNGKMRQYRMRVIAGDRVTVGVSPYDLKRGLITYRAKYYPPCLPRAPSSWTSTTRCSTRTAPSVCPWRGPSGSLEP